MSRVLDDVKSARDTLPVPVSARDFLPVPVSARDYISVNLEVMRQQPPPFVISTNFISHFCSLPYNRRQKRI